MARSNCSCVRPRSARSFIPSDGCLWIEAPSSPSCSGVSAGALAVTGALAEVVAEVVVLFLQAAIAISIARASIAFLIVLILSVAFAAFFLLLSRRTFASGTAAVLLLLRRRGGRGNEDRLRRWCGGRHRRLYEDRRLTAFVFSIAVLLAL